MKNKTLKIVARYMTASGLAILIFYIMAMIKEDIEFEINILPFISLILVCFGYYVYMSALEGPRFLIKFKKGSKEDLELIPILKAKFLAADINCGIKDVKENNGREMRRIAVTEIHFKEALEILKDCKNNFQKYNN